MIKKTRFRFCTDPQKLDRKNLTFGVRFILEASLFKYPQVQKQPDHLGIFQYERVK